VGVRNVRRAAARLRWRNNENERRRRDRWKTERVDRRCHEDVRFDRPPGAVLMVGNGTAVRYRQNGVVTRQVRVQRLTVMVAGLLCIEVNVGQGRGDGAELHEHDERRRGQPTKHPGIVVNRR